MWLKASSSPVILLVCTSSMQVGRAVGEILRLVLQRSDDADELADVADQLGAQRLGGRRDRVALEEVSLDGVEALPADLRVEGRLAHVDQVVEVARVVVDGEARQHEAVDVGLGPLVERPRLRVCDLGAVDVAGLDGGVERLDASIELVDLVDDVRRVALGAVGQDGLHGAGRRRQRPGR